jgi:acetolactate synthase-1/2/3 large subunit
VHPGAEELGHVYQPELAILSGMAPFRACGGRPRADRLARVVVLGRRGEGRFHGLDGTPRDARARPALRRDRLAREAHAEDTIYTNGAGNFSVWLHRFHRYTGWRTQLAPTSGAMGYGVPAAIAAKIARPERAVVCLAGDGDFLMSGHELATAVQYDAPAIFIVVNNGMYGTIRMHQEKNYPGRVIGTDLVNPHFAAFARSFGAVGEIVEDTAQFGPAMERCLAAKKPAVIEVRIDPQAITPNTTLDALRNARR